MVTIPPIYGDLGDGLLLFYPHYWSKYNHATGYREAVTWSQTSYWNSRLTNLCNFHQLTSPNLSLAPQPLLELNLFFLWCDPYERSRICPSKRDCKLFNHHFLTDSRGIEDGLIWCLLVMFDQFLGCNSWYFPSSAEKSHFTTWRSWRLTHDAAEPFDLFAGLIQPRCRRPISIRWWQYDVHILFSMELPLRNGDLSK